MLDPLKVWFVAITDPMVAQLLGDQRLQLSIPIISLKLSILLKGRLKDGNSLLRALSYCEGTPTDVY